MKNKGERSIEDIFTDKIMPMLHKLATGNTDVLGKIIQTLDEYSEPLPFIKPLRDEFAETTGFGVTDTVEKLAKELFSREG